MTQTTIKLHYPLEKLSVLTMRRPKTKDIKKLSLALGPAFFKGLLKGDQNLDKQGLGDALSALIDQDRLDGFCCVIGDLCAVETALIDELDVVDMMAVLGALADFFPQLRQLTSSPS